jgi:glutathione S-transferase
MKLFYSATSPYARKVRVVLVEKAMTDRVELVSVEVYSNPPELIAANPLGKVPTLLLDDGTALFDSPVICAYLDAHPDGKGERLRPHSGNERWMVMRAEAHGDGAMDAAFNIAIEKRKPEGERSPTSVARWREQLIQAIDAMPETLRSLPNDVTLGHLTLACALGYVDLRHGDLEWRKGRDNLAAWYEDMLARPSISSTLPPR